MAVEGDDVARAGVRASDDVIGCATVDDTLCIPGRAVAKYGEFILTRIWVNRVMRRSSS